MSEAIEFGWLLTEYEAADALKLKVATLRRWRWSGKGPHFLKLGGAVRYHPEDIYSFIEDARRQSTSDPGTAQPREAA